MPASRVDFQWNTGAWIESGSEATQDAIAAGIAQLVEHQLPKLRVAGSSPVSRSESGQRAIFAVYCVAGRLFADSVEHGCCRLCETAAEQ